MNFKNRKTQIEIGVAVIALILIGWYFFGSGSSTDSASGALMEINHNPVEEIIGRDLLSALVKMKSVKLNISFFNDSSYKSLEDNTVDIPRQPIGRRDPFAPLP